MNTPEQNREIRLPDWPVTMDIPWIHRYTNWSYGFIEDLIRDREVPARYFGRSRMVRRRDIDAYIDRAFAEEQADPPWVAASKARERNRKNDG